jgi:ribosomal protein S18 acetylase RimI-like enzyme
VKIEPYDPSRRDEVVALSLRAWAPVFASLEGAFGPELYAEMVPDWRASQAKAVAAACADTSMRVWVALEGAQTAGFAALRLHAEDRTGEIYMIAVDPAFQRRGIASALMRRAFEQFRQAGLSVAMVETGGDPGHAPARRAYEAMEFRLFPVARYYKKL